MIQKQPRDFYQRFVNLMKRGGEIEQKIEQLTPQEVDKCIEGTLCSLTFREREIISLRYGLNTEKRCNYTLEEVSKIFCITRERVRQIEAKAIQKLKHPVRRSAVYNLLKT